MSWSSDTNSHSKENQSFESPTHCNDLRSSRRTEGSCTHYAGYCGHGEEAGRQPDPILRHHFAHEHCQMLVWQEILMSMRFWCVPPPHPLRTVCRFLLIAPSFESISFCPCCDRISVRYFPMSSSYQITTYLLCTDINPLLLGTIQLWLVSVLMVIARWFCTSPFVPNAFWTSKAKQVANNTQNYEMQISWWGLPKLNLRFVQVLNHQFFNILPVSLVPRHLQIF